MSTTTKKQRPIKAVTNFRRMAAEAVLSLSNAVYAGIFNNPALTGAPAPPVDAPTLKAANDDLAAANAAALDGGRKAIAARVHQKEIVVKLLLDLAHYAQTNCKEDMTIFLSTGFTAVASVKTATPPVSESIRKIEPGTNSGQMLLTLMKYRGARSYEVRWALVSAGGTPTTWSSQPVTKIKTALTIPGLTPGTTYVFQARAVTDSGYSDWGEPVTRIAL